MSEIRMPRLSDSMTEATIITWLKADGQEVREGEELVEVETDKATVTVSAEQSGVLTVVAPAGAAVSVDEVIARVGEAGEERARVGEAGEERARVGEAGEERDVAPEIAAEAPAAAPAVAAAGAEAGAGAGGNGHAPATPLARRAARHHGIELATLSGTGPRGRITRDDVLSAAGVAAPPPPTAPAAPAAPDGGAQPWTRTQQLIARRMTESRATIPEFEVQTEVVMDEALALRERLRAAIAPDDPLPSLNDVIVRACAIALRRHPRLNATYAEDGLQLHADVNIGIAVATDDALIVPVVRHADTLGLGAIAGHTRRLAGQVRAGRISPAELEGATFTVSNLGMFGMTAIRPVINPPQVAILGVGATRSTLTRRPGSAEIVDQTLMTLTLSADHRAAYGADAARFLSDVRGLLEAPLSILL